MGPRNAGLRAPDSAGESVVATGEFVSGASPPNSAKAQQVCGGSVILQVIEKSVGP